MLQQKGLWKTTSHPLYRAAISLRRFWEISRFIRFDNGNTRQHRKQSDKAVAITDIFLMLNSNLQKDHITPIGVMDAGGGSKAERDSTGRLKHKGYCYICSKRQTTTME